MFTLMILNGQYKQGRSPFPILYVCLGTTNFHKGMLLANHSGRQNMLCSDTSHTKGLKMFPWTEVFYHLQSESQWQVLHSFVDGMIIYCRATTKCHY